MKKVSEKNLRKLVERVRFSHSSDDAYKNLLTVLSEDIREKFAALNVNDKYLLEEILDYIKTWRP